MPFCGWLNSVAHIETAADLVGKRQPATADLSRLTSRCFQRLTVQGFEAMFRKGLVGVDLFCDGDIAFRGSAPAQQRYYELRGIPAAERISRLRSSNFPNEK